MRTLLKALPLFCFCFPVLSARADLVHLKEGGSFEGKASEQGEVVRVALRRGWVEVPKARVARIETGPTRWERYAEKAGALDAKDKGAHLALARWCLAEGLAPESRHHRELALGKPEPPSPDPVARPIERKRPARAVQDLEDDGACEERPVERCLPLRAPRPRTSRSASYPASWTYPVHPGSVWIFPWGTVYGPTLILSGYGCGVCAP